MAIIRGDYIDNSDLSTLITKINEEIARRVPPVTDIAGPAEGSKIDASFFNSSVDRLESLHASHCYCQSKACACQAFTGGGTNGGAIVSHLGCPSNEVTLDSSDISEGDAILAVDSPDTLPDVLELISDIDKLKAQTVTLTSCGAQCSCDSNTTGFTCTCENVCTCQTYCSCQVACTCNTVCCETHCSCDTNCTCDSRCTCDNQCTCEGTCVCHPTGCNNCYCVGDGVLPGT